MAPVNDGGQWDMAVNIIGMSTHYTYNDKTADDPHTEKYGIIPQALFPESFSSSSSSRLDSLITSKLREYALRLRASASSSSSSLKTDPSKLRQMKATFLSEIFNVLSITLGTPPKASEKILWEYYDRDNVFHSFSGSPIEFYEKYGKRKGMNPKDSFSLINDPRNEYEKLYTVERLGNVWGGRPVQCTPQILSIRFTSC